MALALAPVVCAERLKRHIVHKLSCDLPKGPFSVVYMHSTVQKEDNSPGITILRWIYEDLTSDFKDRLQFGLWFM
ncbi:CRAL-TRIO lipid binding domain containing protein [Trema orientale]|uniref:CRAL-TRIO lipid binding domain containing protein n=1 Tax=Trema orientale TaxID=63057 RepID=A0A2P5FLW6_TREOI|nr:CRAL-TRIO lipid binding domain containing protein [Trema orientale]